VLSVKEKNKNKSQELRTGLRKRTRAKNRVKGPISIKT